MVVCDGSTLLTPSTTKKQRIEENKPNKFKNKSKDNKAFQYAQKKSR